jgi:hypothetical protein
MFNTPVLSVTLQFPRSLQLVFYDVMKLNTTTVMKRIEQVNDNTHSLHVVALMQRVGSVHTSVFVVCIQQTTDIYPPLQPPPLSQQLQLSWREEGRIHTGANEEARIYGRNRTKKEEIVHVAATYSQGAVRGG